MLGQSRRLDVSDISVAYLDDKKERTLISSRLPYISTSSMAAISTATRKASRPTSREDFEIAIVCAKGLEYNAVCLLIDGFWDDDGDPFDRARGDLKYIQNRLYGRV